MAREKEREEQDALRKDEDQRKTIIQEERRRHQGVRMSELRLCCIAYSSGAKNCKNLMLRFGKHTCYKVIPSLKQTVRPWK